MNTETLKECPLIANKCDDERAGMVELISELKSALRGMLVSPDSEQSKAMALAVLEISEHE